MGKPDNGDRSNAPQAHLSLWDTVSIIIGIVIGAGIYETAPLIFSNVPGPLSAIGIWILGGALSLVGALCYAELGATYPQSGGDYNYLSKAYGSWAGFLFGWAQLTMIMTGSIGMMAYIFANYAARLWDFGPGSQTVYAIASVVVLSLLNILGVVVGKRTQNLLTGLKVLGLGAIIVAGFLFPVREATTPVTQAASTGSIGLALILVLYTYGGWNDAALVAAEVTDKKRNLPRALILGTLLLTLIYVVVNSAYLLGLGFGRARGAETIAAEVLQRPFGTLGMQAMSVLVMISALGAANGLIYTGSRIYATLGNDFHLFRALARWNPATRSPVISLATQAACTLLLIALIGTQTGRAGINQSLAWAGLTGISWQGYGGFETLLRCTAPIFWLFFLMTGVSLFVLRFRDPQAPRSFRVPLYPLLPLVFCGTCSYMLYSAAEYAGRLMLVAVIPLAAGLVVYAFSRRRSENPATASQTSVTPIQDNL